MVRVFIFINCCDLVFDSLSCGFTRQLFFYLNSLLQVAVVGCDNLCLQLFINMQQFYFRFFLADCRNDFFLEGNQFFDRFVPFEKSFQHDIFRQFLGSRFYHIDSLFGTSHCQFQKWNFFLFLARVDDEFTIYIADLNSCDRAIKRNIWDRKSQRATEHSSHLRRSIFIIRKNSIDNLNFIAETFRKHRANRTVNQTSRQSRICWRTAFTFVKATRIFPSCIHFFLIVDLQWEKVTSSHLFGHGCRS